MFISLHFQRKYIRIPNEIRTPSLVFGRPHFMLFKLMATRIYDVFKEISIQ
jgi:predicted nucleotidyltransferase